MRRLITIYFVITIAFAQRTSFGGGGSALSSIFGQVLSTKMKGCNQASSSSTGSTSDMFTNLVVQRIAGCGNQAKANGGKKRNANTKNSNRNLSSGNNQSTSVLQPTPALNYAQVDANTYVSTTPPPQSLVDWSQYYAQNNGLVSSRSTMATYNSPGASYAFSLPDSTKMLSSPVVQSRDLLPASPSASTSASSTHGSYDWSAHPVQSQSQVQTVNSDSAATYTAYSSQTVRGEVILPPANPTAQIAAVRGSFNPRACTNNC